VALAALALVLRGAGEVARQSGARSRSDPEPAVGGQAALGQASSLGTSYAVDNDEGPAEEDGLQVELVPSTTRPPTVGVATAANIIAERHILLVVGI